MSNNLARFTVVAELGYFNPTVKMNKKERNDYPQAKTTSVFKKHQAGIATLAALTLAIALPSGTASASTMAESAATNVKISDTDSGSHEAIIEVEGDTFEIKVDPAPPVFDENVPPYDYDETALTYQEYRCRITNTGTVDALVSMKQIEDIVLPQKEGHFSPALIQGRVRDDKGYYRDVFLQEITNRGLADTFYRTAPFIVPANEAKTLYLYVEFEEGKASFLPYEKKIVLKFDYRTAPDVEIFEPEVHTDEREREDR